MYNLGKNSCLWIGIMLFTMVLVYMRCTTSVVEPFVVKATMGENSILFDQHDMAAVMNGLKPASISGDFTPDDMKELLRLLKAESMKEFFGDSVTSQNQKIESKCEENEIPDEDCAVIKKFFQLISESRAVFESDDEHRDIQNKDQYLVYLMQVVWKLKEMIDE